MIATPGPAAQGACDLLVRAGVSLHLELRPGRPPGTRAGGGAEGGPCRGAADPGLPRRAPAPRRPGRGHRRRDAGQRARGDDIMSERERIESASRCDAKSAGEARPAMSVLVVGLSHRSAPVELLERAAVGADEIPKLLDEMLQRQPRHRGDDAVDLQPHRGLRGRRRLPRRPRRRLRRARPARRAAAARAHRAPLRALRGLGRAAPVRRRRRAGLDGDRRGADPRPAARRLRRRGRRGHGRAHAARAVAAGAAGRQAGARPHRHRRRGRLGRLGGAGRRRRTRSARPRRACGPSIVGAGAMGALAAAHLRRAGVAEIVVLNRVRRAGAAARREHRGAPAPRPAPPRSRRWPDELATADLLVACTGAVGTVVARETVAAAVVARDGRPLVVCDLGLPRDVDPGVAALPGVTVVDLVALQAPARPRARRGEAVAARPGAGRRGGAGLPRRAALGGGHARR